MGLTWTREGGFRCGLLARWTGGRIGLGRWTQAEVDGHKARAKEQHEELQKYVF